VLPLAERFAAVFAAKVNQAPPTLSAAACDALLAHRWPGNVRELKHAVEHAVVLAGTAPIGPEHLPRSVLDGPPAGASMRDHVDSAEKRAIDEALAAAGGNRARAAEILGVSKRTLQYRLAKLGGKP
jgi:DNA-binding NtrC family response regulator